MSSLLNLAFWFLLAFITIWAFLRYLNFRPAPVLEETSHNGPGTSALGPSQRLRMVTFNVQYLAGTQYSFFYDGGPDSVVSAEEVKLTMKKVVEFILETDADFVFLQEVDMGAKRSGYVDQIAGLGALLKTHYPASVSSYYWQSRFVPHPKVWGPAGMKMVILSKYQLGKAYRHRLAHTPGNPLERDFNIKRAFLEVAVPVTDGTDLILINTHLEAFTRGTRVLELQVEQIEEHLKRLDGQGHPWILAGDFNALPPGQFERLPVGDRGEHTNRAELGKLFERYQGVPTREDATGPAAPRFFTFTVRDGNGRRPVRTLDYVFVSASLQISNYRVEQERALTLSDHLPVIVEVEGERQGAN